MSERDSGLPTTVKIYIAAVLVASVLLWLFYATHPGVGRPHPSVGAIEIAVAAFLFGVGALYAEMHPIEMLSTNLSESRDELVVSTGFYVMSLLLFGPFFTMSYAVAAVLISDLTRRKALHKALFNSGQAALTSGVSGLFLLGTNSNPFSVESFAGAQGAVDLSLCLVAYFLVNCTLMAGVLSLVLRVSFREMWYQVARQGAAQHMGLFAIGVNAAILWTVTPVSLVLLIPSLLVVYLALRTSNMLRMETRQALVSLAGMVDSRDSYSYQHSQEVAHYATLVATKMGLTFEDAEMINLAAQLHDIGKIGTPDQILHKPGALTSEERVRMEDHPVTGAQVLKYFTLFKAGVELVMYHQEHFDGSGYPRGIAGEKIPLGARIIHVADAYQAMTSDRVYRKALPVHEAVRRLKADAGRQFDPNVVDAMLEVLAEQKYAAQIAQATSHAARVPLPMLERG